MSKDSWNEYTGKSWLKVDDVEDENQAFVCVEVEEKDDNGPKIVLHVERGDKKFQFQLNVTNANKCKEFVSSPAALVGKKVYFDKSKDKNPKTNEIVDVLRIYNVVA